MDEQSETTTSTEPVPETGTEAGVTHEAPVPIDQPSTIDRVEAAINEGKPVEIAPDGIVNFDPGKTFDPVNRAMPIGGGVYEVGEDGVRRQVG